MTELAFISEALSLESSDKESNSKDILHNTITKIQKLLDQDIEEQRNMHELYGGIEGLRENQEIMQALMYK